MDTTDAEHPGANTSPFGKRRRVVNVRVTAFGLAACAIGLLLWSRLILVTNHPRTAIAEPPAVRPEAGDKASQTRMNDGTTPHGTRQMADGNSPE